MGGAGEAGIGVTQRELLRSIVFDAMEEIGDQLHRDVQNVQVSMFRQIYNLEVSWPIYNLEVSF
jgi:hypothetical protein